MSHYPRRVPTLLDPIDRVSELLFGLIMVLTFTGSLSVAESGHAEVRAMLVGALGCNLAWGLIDAVFYLMGCLADQGRDLIVWRAAHELSPEDSRRLIRETMPAIAAASLSQAEVESICGRLAGTAPPTSSRLSLKDWLGAGAVFGWVFLVTFPVTIPFMFMDDVSSAMRASDGIALALLYVCGHLFGRSTASRRPWLWGFGMTVLGMVLVALTIALGG